MFRKLICAMTGLLLPIPALAGEYDGVWVFAAEENPDYFIVYQRENRLLLVSAYREMDGWEALMGDFVTDSSAEISSLLNSDGVSTSLTIDFTSPTSAVVTLNSCTPRVECDIPIDVPLSMQKIF